MEATHMFFRRERPKPPTFDERLSKLREAGFAVTATEGGGTQVSRHGCAAVLKDGGAEAPEIGAAGWLTGGEIGLLTDLGYQKIWLTATKRRVPATAAQLKALQNFKEDLREGVGLESLYNESLGTTNDLHIYDRVKGRDRGVPARAWEKKPQQEAAG
jgi:hypothetical protein